MKDNVKKIVLAVVVVLVLVAGVFFLSKKPVNNQNNTNNNPATEQKVDNSKLPDFILGNVKKIEGQNITLAVGAEEKTAVINSSTTFIKQIKEKDAYKNVPATLADIKKGVQIVVYYSSQTGSEYTAKKIQILPF